MNEATKSMQDAEAPAEMPAQLEGEGHSTQLAGMHDLFSEHKGFDAADEEDPLAQLRNDPNYAALIRDLEYIAVQARALFEPAAEEPSDALWEKIQSQLPAKDAPEGAV